MNTLIFIQIDVKSRRIGGATQPLGLRWGFETTTKKAVPKLKAGPCFLVIEDDLLNQEFKTIAYSAFILG